MTREETIKKLDELIATLCNCREQYTNLHTIEQRIFSTLDQLPVSASTRSSIRNIDITVDKSYSSIEGYKAEHDKKTITAMIDILNREKMAQQQAAQEETQKIAIEEQKKGNQIQKNALYVSIVAIIISLASMIVAICK